MTGTRSHCVVVTTCGSKDEAENLAKRILAAKLAACVQMSDITSFYTWEDKLNEDSEILLVMKTRERLFGKLERLISDHHSYDVPEIVQIPIYAGSKKYLDWIDRVTQ